RLLLPLPPPSTLFPYTTLFRSRAITSTAAVLSPSVKRALAALLPPGTLFIESLGASEAGLQAMSWNAAAEDAPAYQLRDNSVVRSEEHTSELQSRGHLVCRLLL